MWRRGGTPGRMRNNCPSILASHGGCWGPPALSSPFFSARPALPLDGTPGASLTARGRRPAAPVHLPHSRGHKTIADPRCGVMDRQHHHQVDRCVCQRRIYFWLSNELSARLCVPRKETRLCSVMPPPSAQKASAVHVPRQTNLHNKAQMPHPIARPPPHPHIFLLHSIVHAPLAHHCPRGGRTVHHCQACPSLKPRSLWRR